MTDSWETPEKIAAAREAFEARLGWRRPTIWGLVAEDGTVLRTSIRGNYLPAVVLATVVGHTAGTAAYRLGPTEIAEAIRLIEPAEACHDMPHPNLWALREVQASGAAAVVVAFVAEADAGDGEPTEEEAVGLLRGLAQAIG